MSPCRPDPLPSEAAEVTLSLQPPRVLWIALSPCRPVALSPVWPSSYFLLSTVTSHCSLQAEITACQFLLSAL